LLDLRKYVKISEVLTLSISIPLKWIAVTHLVQMSLEGRPILGAGHQKLWVSIRNFCSSAASHLRSGADETT